ncbi:MAG: hypothetical protein IM631_21430 [Cytophagales bacterium]|nr:hypothetical protein [Cytophagales bacterium]MCA6373929.1 hypothetical protein [Cytophagales bacterium]MCA6377854.1 hypothetical protein [Cytophagales bacterium]MCA6385893.1 hypothetical protein [Cytophagales bacterium]
MKSESQILESIKSLKQAPFNYKYINPLFSGTAAINGEVEIVRPISVDAYQTDFYLAEQHFKPISKIVDYSPLIQEIGK